MLDQLFGKWWLYIVRGVLAILFGLMALFWPGPTVFALVILFGSFALVDGIFAIATAITFHKNFERWWALLLEGLAGIIMGALTFFWPGITALALLFFIGAWAIVTGIFEIVAAIHFRQIIPGEWLMILDAVLSILFGLVLFVFPAAGALSLVWLIGIYAIVAGVISIIFAFRLRGLKSDIKKVIAPVA